MDAIKLRFHPDTAGMLTALDNGDLPAIAHRLFNVFEDILPTSRRTIIEEIKQTMINSGALGACMSGTGPTVFGIFDSIDSAQVAFSALHTVYKDTYFTESI